MYYEQDMSAVRPLPAGSGAAGPAAGGAAEAVRTCRRLAEAVGADSFSLLFAAAHGEARRLAPVFDDGFPGVSSLSKALSARAAEPFARRIAEAAAPLWWRPREEPPFLTAAARRWAAEVDSPAVGTSGIAFPVAVGGGRCGLVAFAGDDMMLLDEEGLCDVHARCFALLGEVASQRMRQGAKAPPVSRREIECLRLTANGLTSEDIAATLGLSVHTANQYLTNSTHKLNAVNRIHAVAKALRSGLID